MRPPIIGIILTMLILPCFEIGNLNAVQQPELQIEVHPYGDLVLRKLNIVISVEENNLLVSSYTDFESEGLSPGFSFAVTSYGSQLGGFTPASILIHTFFIDYANGSRRLYSSLSPEAANGSLPRRADRHDQFYTLAAYSLYLGDVIGNSRKAFLAKTSVKAAEQNVVVAGQIRLAFQVLGGVGGLEDAHFVRLIFLSSAKGAFVSFDITVGRAESLQVARVDNYNMTITTPSHASYGFYNAEIESRIVSLEWKSRAPSRFSDSNHSDWLVWGLIWALVGALLVLLLYSRVRPFFDKKHRATVRAN